MYSAWIYLQSASSRDGPLHSGKYIALFPVDPLCSSRIRHSEWVQLYTARFEYPQKWLQRWLVVAWLVSRETAAVWAHVLCTCMQPCTSLQCQFIRSHIRRMHVCLAVACPCCHLHVCHLRNAMNGTECKGDQAARINKAGLFLRLYHSM